MMLSIHQMSRLSSIKKSFNQIFIDRELIKTHLNMPPELIPEKVKQVKYRHMFWGLYYTIFSFLGLVTSNWLLFIAYLIKMVIFSNILNRLKYTKTGYFLYGISLALTLIIFIFAILNYYHFHIDLWQWLKTLFSY
jgi:hypothetical protein